MHRVAEDPSTGSPYKLRAGVHTGEVTRDGDDVLGLPVVIASRLCDLADGGETLVSEACAALVRARHDFQFEDRGRVELKGIPDSVSVRQLVRADSPNTAPIGVVSEPHGRSTSASDPIVRARCPVTVGREEAVMRASALLAENSEVVMMLVTGEAGLGKSRLVSEVVDRSSELGWRVRRGDCFEPDQTLPYGLFLDLLASDPLLASIEEEFHEVLALPSGNEDLDRRRASRVLTRVLDVDEPTLLVLEDLHWCDEVSIEVIAHLARVAGRTKTRLIVTFRHDENTPTLDGLLARLERLRTVEEIRLDHLGSSQIAAMAESMIGRPLSGEQLRGLVDLSDGVPFFVEELVHHVVSDSAGAPRMPKSVDHTVGQRLDGVDPGTRQALLRAAVIGRDVNVEVLAALMGWRGQVSEHVGALLASGLVVERGPLEVRFVHELARHAVVRRLLASERVVIHRDIADLLAGGAATSERDRVDLARHAFEGHAWDVAARVGLEVARSALGQGAPRAALAHLDWVVQACEHSGGNRVAALLARSECLDRLGRVAAAEADAVDASVRAGEVGDIESQWRASLQRVRLAAQRSRDEAARLIADSVEFAERLGEPVRLAETLALHGNLAINDMQLDVGIDRLEHAMTHAISAADDRTIAAIGEQLMVAHTLSGDCVSARRHGQAAVERLRTIGDSAALVTCLTTLGATGGDHQTEFCRPSGPLSRCAAEVTEALSLARQIDWPAGEAFAARTLGGVRSCQGRFAESLELLEASVAIAEAIDHPVHVLRGLTVLGEVHQELGDLERALALHERALRMGRESGYLAPALLPLGRLAAIDIVHGRLDDAQAKLRELEVPSPVIRCLQSALRAEILTAREEHEEALAALDSALLSLPPGTLDDPPVRIALLRAEVLIAMGRFDDADGVLRAGEAAARTWGMTVLVWRCVAARARLRQRAGDRETARRLSDEVWTLVDTSCEGLSSELTKSLRADVSARVPMGPTNAPVADDGPTALTRRETEVALELAKGRSNREIAETLVISVHTAETHVKRILAKLGLRSRAQVAHWAHESGLLDGSDGSM